MFILIQYSLKLVADKIFPFLDREGVIEYFSVMFVIHWWHWWSVWVSPKMQIAEARGEDSKVQYLASSEARSRRPVVRSAKSAGHSLFGGGGGTKEVRTIFFFFFDRRCD